MLTITLEKILKEFSITELESIVFRANSIEVRERFLNLSEIETDELRDEMLPEKKYSS